jgi:CMP-N,N'-diacetyllegionaminic acid synthase
MRILFTICGRAGSKGIKNKNLRTFCGKYLAHYTIAAIDMYLKKHPEIQADIVVNSDSIELLDLVSGNGLLEVSRIVRDESLAGDTIGKIAVINDCLVKMKERTSADYDMVVDLDITSPLRTVKDLENTIAMQIETNADVVTTVAPARRNPYFNQVMRTDHGVKKVIDSNYTARQQAPDIFDLNASIYAYNPSFLSSGKGVLDGYCEVVEMYDTGILDLDHINDFELMEVIAKYMFVAYDDYREIYEHIPAN